jgi:hypothetical protein
MDKIVDYFNQYPFEILVKCFKKSKLPNSKVERMSLSLSLTQNPFSTEEEFIAKFASMVVSNFNDEISKKVFKYIFDFGKKSYVDLRNQFGASSALYQTQMTKSRKILSEIYHKNWNHVITNGRISSEYIMDSSAFQNLPLSNSVNSSNGLSYPIGKLMNMEIWIDPYMRWDDNYMISFGDVLTEVSNFRAQIINGPTFAPQLLIDFDFRFEVVEPEIFFVFEDEYMKNWSNLKQEHRDKKIDYILNGNKESRQNSQFEFYSDTELEP